MPLILYYYIILILTFKSRMTFIRHAVRLLKIKNPVNFYLKNQQVHKLVIQFINYVW